MGDKAKKLLQEDLDTIMNDILEKPICNKSESTCTSGNEMDRTISQMKYHLEAFKKESKKFISLMNNQVKDTQEFMNQSIHKKPQ